MGLAVAYIQNNEFGEPEIGNVQQANNYKQAYDIAVKMVREFYKPRRLQMVFDDAVCTTNIDLREYFIENDMVCFFDKTTQKQPYPKITVQIISIDH